MKVGVLLGGLIEGPIRHLECGAPKARGTAWPSVRGTTAGNTAWDAGNFCSIGGVFSRRAFFFSRREIFRRRREIFRRRREIFFSRREKFFSRRQIFRRSCLTSFVTVTCRLLRDGKFPDGPDGRGGVVAHTKVPLEVAEPLV